MNFEVIFVYSVTSLLSLKLEEGTEEKKVATPLRLVVMRSPHTEVTVTSLCSNRTYG